MLTTSKLILSLFLLGFFSFNLYAAQKCDDYIDNRWEDSRYTVANGTVVDKVTKLMWKQCMQGFSGNDCLTGALPSPINWQTALKKAQDSTFAGHDNWRLPNIKEFHSLAKLKCILPSINKTIFPNVTSNPTIEFWSSSPYAMDSTKSWIFSSKYGDLKKELRTKELYVRLVRSRD